MTEVHRKYIELLKELGERGYYVQPIGLTCYDEVDYIIVSCIFPSTPPPEGYKDGPKHIPEQYT